MNVKYDLYGRLVRIDNKFCIQEGFGGEEDNLSDLLTKLLGKELHIKIRVEA